MWNLLAQMSNDPAAAAAAEAGVMAMILGFGIALFIGIFAINYIVWALALTGVAKKLDSSNAGRAWIPLAQFMLGAEIAGLPSWVGIALCASIIGFFVPVVNSIAGLAFVILSIVIWWKITEKRGKPGPLALLILVPCVGWLYPLYPAYAD